MHLVIFDTEFTSWPGAMERNWSGEGEYREIFQIAAIKMRLENRVLSYVESFNEIIKPTINPNLSEYIIELTQIRQDMVDDLGIDFRSSFGQFQSFFHEEACIGLSWGNDEEVLRENCRINKCSEDWVLPKLLNLRKIALSKQLSGTHLVSGELAKHYGVELKGHKHNALHDVKSIAATLQIWIENADLSRSDFI